MQFFTPQVWCLFKVVTYLRAGLIKKLDAIRNLILSIIQFASLGCQYSSLTKERSCASCPGKGSDLQNIYRTTYCKNV